MFTQEELNPAMAAGLTIDDLVANAASSITSQIETHDAFECPEGWTYHKAANHIATDIAEKVLRPVLIAILLEASEQNLERAENQWKQWEARSAQVELDAVAQEARRYAGFYPEASDCRNTFIIFAEQIEARSELVPNTGRTRPIGHVSIAHDGFAGDIVGHYTTREGKDGVVVQQDGTKVVHVYGEKWLSAGEAHRG